MSEIGPDNIVREQIETLMVGKIIDIDQARERIRARIREALSGTEIEVETVTGGTES